MSLAKVQQKLRAIYNDLEHNVTKIYDRHELMLVYDLAYHSVLQFELMGQMLTRGWVEVLVVGDTRCGKTKTVERLRRHYRAGDMGTGENTSIAGLIGGMQQINRQWSVTWGKIPRNDRRLVIIDEASNLDVHAISQFATIRSEGVARITKIQMEQTFARTREVWVSNPRGRNDGTYRPISGYDYGVLTIPELIGRQADVARFDLATVVSNGEVPPETIFKQRRAKVQHDYTSDRCHNLVLWAWSRRPQDVVITSEAEDEILIQSKKLSTRYHESIPLVKYEELPEKLARLAVALATRLFNTTDNCNVVVLPEHVVTIADFIDHLYSKPSMAYSAYSKNLIEQESVENPNDVLAKIVMYGPEFLDGLLGHAIIRQSTIEDLAGLERDKARQLTSYLVRKRCLIPEQLWYRKTKPFIRLLKDVKTGAVKVELKEEF